MADIVMIGGGIAGLGGSMLLARDGHRVTLLERDPEPPPAPPDAWAQWTRRGVNQFRLPHAFLPRFRQLVDDELPDVATALEAAGALRTNRLALLPTSVTGGWWPGDERYEVLTGRRPVVEATLARLAAREPGVVVRRGVAVRGLMASDRRFHGTPHVRGVVTDSGERISADLVVDAGGRRSALPDWLGAIGARRPEEEQAASGFVYFCRHFRSADGSMPVSLGPPNQPYESVSLVTLAADNGYWSVVVVGSAKDLVLRRARQVDVWERIVRSYPLVAHWIDAEPVTGIDVMAKIEDRVRRYVVDGAPVATGVVAVGDAVASTSPALGRGASLALLQVSCLRDHLRESSTADPIELSRRWEERTAAAVAPLVDDTLRLDRHRRAQVESQISGVPYAPDDPGWRFGQALMAAAAHDPGLIRAAMAVASLLERGADIARRPEILERVQAVGPVAPPPGPSRAELVELIGRAAAERPRRATA